MHNYANFTKPNENADMSFGEKYPSNQMPNVVGAGAFGREMEFMRYGNKNGNRVNQVVSSQMLNDREMFNKFSNSNDSIDTSSFSLADSYGMPVQGGMTSNNKKSLLATPYISESNNKNNWVASSTGWNHDDMFAELESDLGNQNTKINQNKFTGSNDMDSNSQSMLEMAYNSNLMGVQEDNGLCKIEADCLGFEYELTKQKKMSKDIIIDVSSPFALGYIWKSLILLSKNPSTDKLVKLLGIKSKDSIVSDMKRHADVFEDSGKIQISIPSNLMGQTPNTNFINKIKEVYKISVVPDNESYENVVKVNLNWNFLLEIPFYYQPKIITEHLVGYLKSKTKFIELTDVPIFLMVDKTKNIVCVEIPFASNMILGFVYTPSRDLVQTIPYELLTMEKKPEVLAKRLVIPKINRNKQSVYSKNFKEVLEQIHLGEVVYGTLYRVEIAVEMGLSIGVSKSISKNKYSIAKSFDDITINHKCFYYVKNSNIPNKILSTGMICY